MKRRWTVFPLALVAVLACASFAAASASANPPRWKVNGAYLGANVAKPFTSTSGVSRLRIPLLGVTIVCNKDKNTGSIVGSAAGSPGTNKEVVVTFEECRVEGAEEVCTVGNGKKIITNKLKSELVWLSAEGLNAGDLLTPEVAGQPFTTIVVEGAECPLPKENKITGEALGKIEPINAFAVTGTLTFTDPAIAKYWTGDRPLTEKEKKEGKKRTEHANGGLKFGANPAVFSSVDSVTLNSGEEFGVFE